MKAFFAMGTNRYDPERGNVEWLHINNFGYYRNITEDIKILRPQGRKDYHLLYASNGEITIGGNKLKNGGFYIFNPNEPQSYTYQKQENCLYYWIHFTGNRAGDILTREGLCSGVHFGNGRKNETDALFRLLTDALAHRGEQNFSYAVSLLFSLLKLLSSPPAGSYPFLKAVNALEDVGAAVQVNELAALYQMSPAHFIRSFKSVYGTTPANYRIVCQLTRAKSLLSDTEMSVSGIAEQCGFSDSFYFSRLFKKHIGISPSLYRKQTYME